MKIIQLLNPTGAPGMRELPRALKCLSEVARVSVGFEEFWTANAFDADILHLHWPESLVRWREPAADEIDRVADRLNQWKRHAKVIATIHNRHPHHRDSAGFRRLYQTVYDRVDGVVHMGRASADEMNGRFPGLEVVPSVVIPHGLPPFEANVQRERAKDALGIPRDAVTMASLCRIRDPSETGLLFAAFRGIRRRRKRLIVAGARTLPASRLQRWRERAQLLDPRIMSRNSLIADEDVPRYIGPADVFIIPRNEILNSGGIATGFLYGQVVVGPAVGVVGEVLEQTGNPAFVPGDSGSVARAMGAALELGRQGKGEDNRRYALENWRWDRLAALHLDFYRRVNSPGGANQARAHGE